MSAADFADKTRVCTRKNGYRCCIETAGFCSFLTLIRDSIRDILSPYRVIYGVIRRHRSLKKLYIFGNERRRKSYQQMWITIWKMWTTRHKIDGNFLSSLIGILCPTQGGGRCHFWSKVMYHKRYITSSSTVISRRCRVTIFFTNIPKYPIFS